MALEILNKGRLNPTKAVLAGILVFAGLTVLSRVFYLERIIMPDTAFQLFEIITRKGLAIQTNRFGAAATQAFPLLGVKLGWSLNALLVVYSFAFVAFPLFLFILLAWGFKNRTMALALGFFTLMLTNHSFYWVQSELLQGCALLLFVFGVATAGERMAWWRLILLFPLAAVVIFFHPLTFIPWVFLSGFFLASLPLRRQPAFWLFCLSGLIWLGVKFILVKTADYDAGAYKLSEGLLAKIPGFFSWRSTRLFGGYLFSDYYVFLLLFLVLAAIYFRRRQWWKAGLVTLFSLGYIVLINGTFDWGGVRFHTESFYQPLGIFVFVPFLYDLAPGWQLKRWFWPAVFALIVVRLVHIAAISPEYRKRIDWYERLLERTRAYPGTKFAVDQQNVPMGLLQLSWGSSFETLYLSARRSPDSTRTVIIYDPNVPMDKFLPQNNAFFQPFGAMPYEWFRTSPYFHFRDTSHYRVLGPEAMPQ